MAQRLEAAVISKFQKYLFFGLLVACVAMAAFLIRLRNRAQDRLAAQARSAPAEIEETRTSAPRTVTLYLPNDLDDSLTAVDKSISLPADRNAQARVILESLIEAYNAPGSTHPMQVASGIDDVYFLAVPEGKDATGGNGQMAVVDLSGALVAAQPSGIEPETLTLLSMMATLHANLPAVTEVHFLVDGQPRETLAGHADLTRTYMAGEETSGQRTADRGQAEPSVQRPALSVQERPGVRRSSIGAQAGAGQ
jgi:Sporulation and spore germination